MRRRLRPCEPAALLCLLAVVAAAPARAADRYALIVTGASGGEQYAARYDEWRRALVQALARPLNYPADHIVALAEKEDAAQHVGPATRAGVERALADLRRRVAKEDALLVVLIGHGAVEDEDAKFNLVGPDLTATQWAEAIRPIAGTVVFVDTTGGSFPFLKKLAGPRRIVLTATDSAAQQFETVFPEFFIKALTDAAADADKNGRVSVWEAFTYASAGVRQSFEQRAQLPTERPLIDDRGTGAGHEADSPLASGQTPSRATFLQRDAPPVVGEGAAGDLQKQRADLEAQVEALKARKQELRPEDYDAQLERLLTDLARVSAALRNKS